MTVKLLEKEIIYNEVQYSTGASEFEFSLLIGALYVGSLSMVLVFGEWSERK